MSTRTTRRAIPSLTVSVSAALLMSACTGSTSPGDPNSGGSINTVELAKTSTGTATKNVDAVTWYGDYRPIFGLDPLKLADYPEETIIPNICEPMIRFGTDYKRSAGIVSFKQNSATKLTLTLRSGVTFSNGRPVTAEDVKFSLERNMDPSVASNYAYLYNNVAGIKATGRSTIVVTMKKADVTFVDSLATLAGAVVEKEFTERAGAGFGSPGVGVMCTGPFKFTSYDGTSKLVVSRNERYWDKARAAKAKKFTFVFTADPSALANGLKSGTIDGAYNLPGSLIGQLKSAPNGKVYIGSPGSTPINVDILMTKSTGALSSPTVRQALSLALDRDAIAEKIYQSTADPLYKVSGPGLWGYARDAYAEAYKSYKQPVDVEQAKKMVSAAGATGKSASFAYAAGDPQNEQFATVLKQTAQQIGINLKIVGLPGQQFGNLFADAKAREKFDALLTKNYVEFPEPAAMDVLFGRSDGGTNFSGYKNQAVDDALDAARGTADDEARAKLVLKAEAQLAKDLPSIPVVQPRSVVFQNNRLTGATLSFSFMSAPWAAAIGGK